MSEQKTRLRLYHVKCWEPAVSPAKWGRHNVYGVICHSAVEAVAHVAALHPNARIDAVNDGGIVHYVLAPLEGEIRAATSRDARSTEDAGSLQP